MKQAAANMRDNHLRRAGSIIVAARKRWRSGGGGRSSK